MNAQVAPTMPIVIMLWLNARWAARSATPWMNMKTYGAPEIVGKGLARPPQLGREEFSEEGPKGGINAKLEGAVDESAPCERETCSSKRRVKIKRYRQDEPDGERAKGEPPSEPVGKRPIYEEPYETPGAVHQHVVAGKRGRKPSFMLEEGRQIVTDRIARALGAYGEQSSPCSHRDLRAAEDGGEAGGLQAGAPGLLVDGRVIIAPTDKEDEQRGEDPDPKDCAPAISRADACCDRAGQERRHSGADGCRTVHGAQGATTVLRLDQLAQQHGTHGPFGAETQSLQCAQDEQLVKRMGEA